jgi:hypothetical protein
MEKSLRLIKLAKKLSIKYAGGVDAEGFRSQIENTIWTALGNASTVTSLGMLPFVQMAKDYGITLSFDVTRTDSWNGTPNITVDNISIRPIDMGMGLLPKFERIADPIENYLEKYPDLYPTKINGEDIKYNNFKIRLSYGRIQ